MLKVYTGLAGGSRNGETRSGVARRGEAREGGGWRKSFARGALASITVYSLPRRN